MPISPRIILAQRINSIAKMIRDVYAVLNRRKKRYIIPKKTSLCPPCAQQGVSVPSVFPQRVLIQIDIIFGQMEIVKTL